MEEKELLRRNEEQNPNENSAVHENKMGIMPVKKLLISMAWPAMLSMTINALYNVVDSIFVAWLSEDAFTAVSIVNPIQMLIISLAVGSGVGVNSLIARLLGAKNQEGANKAASASLRIGLFNYLVFFIVGAFLTKFFVSAYAQEGTEIYDAALTYMRIVCIGCLFINVEVQLEKVLQSTGNMVAPMICSLTGAIVNIVFDPILIFGLMGFPAMGVAGAAIATVFGQLCSLIVAVVIILKGEHLVEIRLRGFKMDWGIVKDIYKVGFPSIIMQAIGSVMLIFYNMILVAYSTTAVAVLGVYFKMQSFVFMPVFGLNQGAMPIMGYNYGAKNKKRLMETYKWGLTIALIVMALGTLLFQLFPSALLSMFDASAEMYKIGVPALRIISICFIPAAFGIMTSTLFQGTGHGMLSLYGSLLRQLIGILPLAYILIRIGGVTLSWTAFPLAEILGLTYSAVVLRWLYKKEIANL
ncbi:MAG: MATE family efflux transporter [Firmicutes bacterium]|nr:MATE family efflux transporter [Bacillota bacterium]